MFAYLALVSKMFTFVKQYVVFVFRNEHLWCINYISYKTKKINLRHQTDLSMGPRLNLHIRIILNMVNTITNDSAFHFVTSAAQFSP